MRKDYLVRHRKIKRLATCVPLMVSFLLSSNLPALSKDKRHETSVNKNSREQLIYKGEPKGLSVRPEKKARLLAVKTAEVDYEKAGKEATDLLAQYLRIDTTVPPGNEKKGAEFLASILKRDGIESQLLETAPDRSCIYARLKGTGKKRPIVLLNHIDVVPAKAADWTHPPFAGEIHDGELWGRGAIDMKSLGIFELECMLMLKRNGVTLDRDIIFIGTPDEEVGGQFGAGWFVKNHPDLVSGAEFLLNEGFGIETDNNGKATYWGVDFGEKSPLWLEVKTKGAAGHASMPLEGSATNRLVRALSKIDGAGPNFKLLPPVKEYFQNIAKFETDPEVRKAYENIEDSVKDPTKQSVLLKDILKSSTLRNTISLTVLNAGYKTNVIPAEAFAQLDCRLLPDVTKEEFIEWIKKVINDPEVSLNVLEFEKSSPSDIKTDLYNAIKKVAAEESADIPVVPIVVPWFTDSHWFRNLGIISYGFMPFEIDKAHMATMHGKDERIPLKAIENGVRRLYKVLLEVGGTSSSK
ncbi:MAG: M20/M25/M40 family metallo-hydrolase [Cyanobacteria bacterium]|nr:M20/M25/M40 family metallo-hydrolase [Cyanobacteriota bacterium]